MAASGLQLVASPARRKGTPLNYLPLIIIAAALLGAITLTRRNRARAIADQQQQEEITFGTEIQTTSGLYGTVVGLNDDDTVQLAIAPGVEVKWARAALRDVSSLRKSTPSRPVMDDESDEEPESGDKPQL
jgi:preprotein translocase subunit YajC